MQLVMLNKRAMVLKLTIYKKNNKNNNKLTVSKKRKTRELVNPPNIVNSSDEANFPLYISWSEKVTTNKRSEYNIEFPDSGIVFNRIKNKNIYIITNQ